MTPVVDVFPGTVQNSSFGDVLRWFRVQRMYSQAELAERSGLREKSISALETGLRNKPHFSTLRALAEALSLDESERSALLAATMQAGSRRWMPLESDRSSFGQNHSRELSEQSPQPV